MPRAKNTTAHQSRQMVLHLAALFIYRPPCLQSFLLTTFAPFLGLHHSSSIQHNVRIMRSVWLALLCSLQRNNITTNLHHHQIRNANQATVRAHAPHNLRYVKCRLRCKVAASCKATSFTLCTLHVHCKSARKNILVLSSPTAAQHKPFLF